MNIGIVTTWFERGAAYVSKQFEEILCEKYNVFIYARGGEAFAKGNPKWDKPNVYWSKFSICDKYIDKNEFQSWMRKNEINVILFNEQDSFEPILYCKELGVKTLAYIDYYTEETVPLFNVYDALICNTKRHLSAFEDHPHAYYIPWGTDVDLYKPSSDDGHLVNNDCVTFFNSAGMNPLRKGTDTFIKALDLCKDRSRIRALIHSQKNLRSFFPKLSLTIDKLEKEGVLEVVEKTIPAPGIYYKADVYVYPSILDGIGLTVPEAISSGLVCIASDNPPMNEFIDESCGNLIPINRLYARKDGYYWPQCRCDASALSQLIQYYASNPIEVVKKKVSARKYAVENLSFSKNSVNLLKILECIEFTEPSSELIVQIEMFDNKFINKIKKIIIKNKLYLLPISLLKRIVGSHVIYKFN